MAAQTTVSPGGLELGFGGPQYLTGSADPTSGGGVVAPIASVYIRTTNGTVYSKTGAGNTAWTAVGVSTPYPVATTVEIGTTNVAGSTYGTSAIQFIPMASGSDSLMQFQFTSAYTGTINIIFDYAMSAANGGTVILNFSRVGVVDGGDPNASPTATTGQTLTPGNDANKHTLDGTVSGFSALSFAATAGQVLYCVLERPVAGGTHPGEFRILQIRVTGT